MRKTTQSILVNKLIENVNHPNKPNHIKYTTSAKTDYRLHACGIEGDNLLILITETPYYSAVPTHYKHIRVPKKVVDYPERLFQFQR